MEKKCLFEPDISNDIPIAFTTRSEKSAFGQQSLSHDYLITCSPAATSLDLLSWSFLP